MTKDIWQQKSDEELITASEHLSDYTAEAEEVIRAELQRRGMSEPEPTVRPDPTLATYGATGGNPVMYRYLDLYRAARLLVGIGNTVKVFGIVVGIGILLLSLVVGLAGSSQTSNFLFGMFGAGAVFGAFVGGIIFLLGILISAQGQILLAQADSAVHTSPFMTEGERAKVMSLPFPRAHSANTTTPAS